MKIGIAGYKGRMGQTLVQLVKDTSELTLAAASESENTLSNEAFFVTAQPAELVAHCDAVIDFTSPEATLHLAREVAKAGKIHIIGTTGFSTEQKTQLMDLAAHCRVVMSGNFSIGVNMLAMLVEQAARALDASYDIEIMEMHHSRKKDAPSGTALLLGQAAAAGRDVSLAEKKILDRDGVRRPGDIGFAVLRGGSVIGEHSVYFAGEGERIELKHEGFDRHIYARGALRAALWAKDQPHGCYTMQDVLKPSSPVH